MTDLEGGVARHNRGTRIIIILLFVSLFALASAFGLLWLRYQKVAYKQQPRADTARLIESIGKLIALPDEQANLATVVDKTKLGDAQLARDAQNGDQLLIFSEARRVILYRPSTQKVIDMFHITPEQARPAVTPTPQPQSVPRR